MENICLSQNNFNDLLKLAINNCQKFDKNEKNKRNEKRIAMSINPTISLRTVNYNIFGRWLGLAGYEGQKERLAAIPQAIYQHPKLGPTVDVITIEESWCPTNTVGSVVCQGANDRTVLLQEFAKYGWKYSTPVVEGVALSTHGSAVNGGSLIVSRWPILANYQAVYHDASAGDDTIAAKGVMYIRIMKEENGIKQAFNIFGTHLQAWSNEKGAAARAKQLQQLKDFENQLGIPTDGSEPVIYQGDMNTDQINYPNEVQNMLNVLNAKFPEKIGEQKYSSDPSTNFLVGKDGAADDNKCLLTYQQNLNNGRPNLQTRSKCTFPGSDDKCLAYCSCCPHEMLDYILYCQENKYLQPISSTVEIIPLKSVNELTYDWSWCVGAKCLVDKKPAFQMYGNDLSDHYPVVANFVFQPTLSTVTSFPLLDGCKFDSDCTYDAWNANCKCTGDNCSYKNKYYKSNTGWFSKDIRADDGTNLGIMNSPLNKNCHYQASLAKCFCRPGDKF